MTAAINTWGFCRGCCDLRPAARSHNGVSVLITTYCPEHGVQVGVREPSLPFYQWQLQFGRDAYMKHRPEGRAVSINVTDRCNTHCRNCYHSPSDSPDPSIEEVIDRVVRLPSDKVNFLGAEPTIRDDLPELIAKTIERTGKRVSFYTNGLRLKDRTVTEAVKAAGAFTVGVSVHLPQYVGKENHEERMEAIGVVYDVGLPIWCLSFTVTDLVEISQVFDILKTLDVVSLKVGTVAIRTSGAIGADRGTRIPLSALALTVAAEFAKRGIAYKVQPYSGPLFVVLNAGGIDFNLMRMWGAEEYDHADALVWPTFGALLPEFKVEHVLLQINKLGVMRAKHRRVKEA